jgi:hypothetical protein
VKFETSHARIERDRVKTRLLGSGCPKTRFNHPNETKLGGGQEYTKTRILIEEIDLGDDTLGGQVEKEFFTLRA